VAESTFAINVRIETDEGEAAVIMLVRLPGHTRKRPICSHQSAENKLIFLRFNRELSRHPFGFSRLGTTRIAALAAI
jgi:hypothetical protein